MQQKVESDKRWHDKTLMAELDVRSIVNDPHLRRNDENPLLRLWHAMNQKFHKKQLWWENRYAKAQRHIKHLEGLLAERRVEKHDE